MPFAMRRQLRYYITVFSFCQALFSSFLKKVFCFFKAKSHRISYSILFCPFGSGSHIILQTKRFVNTFFQKFPSFFLLFFSPNLFPYNTAFVDTLFTIICYTISYIFIYTKSFSSSSETVVSFRTLRYNITTDNKSIFHYI